MAEAVQQLPLTTEQRINRLELALKHERNNMSQLRTDFQLLEGEMNRLRQNMDVVIEKYLAVLNVVGRLAQKNDGVSG